MFTEFIAAQVAKGCSLALDVAEHYLHLYCRFWLRAFLMLVTSVEDVLTTIFDWESRILSAPSCGVYSPHESAIVIVGGEAGEFRRLESLLNPVISIPNSTQSRPRPRYLSLSLGAWIHRFRPVNSQLGTALSKSVREVIHSIVRK